MRKACYSTIAMSVAAANWLPSASVTAFGHSMLSIGEVERNLLPLMDLEPKENPCLTPLHACLLATAQVARSSASSSKALMVATALPLPSPSPLHKILVKMEEDAPNKRNEVALLIDHIFKEFKWGEGIVVSTYEKGVFVNGFMHMLEFTQIVVVDMEGKTWRKIRRPIGDAISIHEAQGQLYLCTADTLNRYKLSIWILEDYVTSKWTLKHKVTMLELFGKKNIEIGTKVCDVAYRVIAVYLEWNLILLVGEDKSLFAYDMNRSKVYVLPAQAIGYPRSTWKLLCMSDGPHYLPYVPLFMESLAKQ
ncbi:uncharacterized protein [Miscanthus floridulus]|uniref:uncharacterized protein n=1 Tax=Miscanthus floridulus TaxID=154761 RepID=UPI00345AB9E8